MLHDVTLDGRAFRLRPITDADAAFVVDLRSNPALNRYIHASTTEITDQLAWLSRYYSRPGDYYFILERIDNSCPEGVISIYDVDSTNRSAEWGRWILKPGSLAAIESAWLIYQTAFEILDLESVYCRTVADNTKVVSFHDSCGINLRVLLPKYFQLGEARLDAIEHRVTKTLWPQIASRLEKLANMTARRIIRD